MREKNAQKIGADRATLGADFRRLGLTSGMTVLVHASLRALRPDSGGPATVLNALIDVLGDRGTLVVPAQTTWNSTSSPGYRLATACMTDAQIAQYRASIARFDPSSTPSSNMGVLAEYVRTRPGAVRSTHPQTSFAAIGARAGDLMRVHDLDCHLGSRSPIGALYEDRASILHLGTGYGVSTIFHLAEYGQPDQPLRSYECRVTEAAAGQRSEAHTDGWVSFKDIHLDDSDFARLGADFERHTGSVRKGVVGHADALLFPAVAAVDYAVGWMAQERGLRRITENSVRSATIPLSPDSQSSYR